MPADAAQVRGGGVMGGRGAASPGASSANLGGGFPSANRGFREGATFSVDPSTIGHRVHSLAGGVDRGVRLDKQRRLLAEGKADPIKMAIDSKGTLEIIDGRHRWLAASESGRPVRVRLYKSRRINTDGLINLK